MKTRSIIHISRSQATLEGAGVHLRRAFGFGDTQLFDPFLLLDDFRGDDPAHYSKGFPWHPHRGIETITYMLTAASSTATAWATGASSAPATCSG